MKLGRRRIAGLCGAAAALPLVVAAGCSAPTDLQDRFESIERGARRERVVGIYGIPYSTALFYDTKNIARHAYLFEGDRLLKHNGVVDSGNPDLRSGMSMAEVQALRGKPRRICDYYTVPDHLNHVFCYIDGRLSDKQIVAPPVV